MEYIKLYLLIGLTLLSWLVIAQIILSFLPISRSNTLLVFVDNVLMPIYRIVRIIPHRLGFVDFSPMIAIILIDLTKLSIINYF